MNLMRRGTVTSRGGYLEPGDTMLATGKLKAKTVVERTCTKVEHRNLNRVEGKRR